MQIISDVLIAILNFLLKSENIGQKFEYLQISPEPKNHLRKSIFPSF